ncbi:MAG TPA: hypothetical protein VM912_13330, partial [Terriglobales bacterium]|nr:hypothetical protein [Terriglobales bacterium]
EAIAVTPGGRIARAGHIVNRPWGTGEQRNMGMKFLIRIAAIAALACMNCRGQTGHPTPMAGVATPKLEAMPATLETRFALSAAPPHLRDAATVYLLDPAHGYVLGGQGKNGISCIVVRSDWQWPDRPFRDDIFWPVCYDSEGSKTLLQDYIYAAELRAEGMDEKRVHEEVIKRFGTAAYPNPARSGVAYMIAPIMRGYPGPKTMNLPHYMFYAPGVINADIGGKPYSHYPFVLDMSPGRDDVIIMLAGETEKREILWQSKSLPTDLCKYREFLCTTPETQVRMPNDRPSIMAVR